ncbi:hypothetical protein GH714_010316 [Hevea brasiliensis]|uniref:PWWP domain-containing protein n=1 Tax=Hevea brasiliensis TaxID=3981 RepID=A0A6A6M4A3_HEVBR|nr:hypothetical protein GH714_010316 [Hevea brasiliensis]
MKTVENRPKALSASPSLSQEPQESYSSDLVATEVSVEREFGGRYTVDLGGNEGSLDDSEINGASSLLKMHESKSLRGLGSVLDVIDKTGKRGFESVDGISLVADICGDVHPSGIKANRKFGRIVRGQSLDANERYQDGKNRELSDSKDWEGEENMEDGHEFSVGDFVWGKIKSHPWWPGRIYDPLDASDYAKKLNHGIRFLWLTLEMGHLLGAIHLS